MSDTSSLTPELPAWDERWMLAVVFGLASVPWTFAFVAGQVPLWPSFIASATFYAVDEEGLRGLKRGYASNLAGIAYAALTLAIVDILFGGNLLALSVVVGVFMFLASLHAFLPLLSFTPGGFFGYATMFSVSAADASIAGLSGLTGETLAAVSSMLIGAFIGVSTDVLSKRLS